MPTAPKTVIGIIGNDGPGLLLLDDVSLFKCNPASPPSPPAPVRSPNPPSPPAGGLLPDYGSSCDLVSGWANLGGAWE